VFLSRRRIFLAASRRSITDSSLYYRPPGVTRRIALHPQALRPKGILCSRRVVSGLSSRPVRLRVPSQRSSSSPAVPIIPRVPSSGIALFRNSPRHRVTPRAPRIEGFSCPADWPSNLLITCLSRVPLSQQTRPLHPLILAAEPVYKISANVAHISSRRSSRPSAYICSRCSSWATEEPCGAGSRHQSTNIFRP
jgi:hypothetical protein